MVAWIWSETYYETDSYQREGMLEGQYNVKLGHHVLVMGVDYTRNVIRTQHPTGDWISSYTYADFGNDQGSAYIEDEIALTKNLWATLGFRGHYNEWTHFDWAGKAVMVWEAAPQHFLRGGITRSFLRPSYHKSHRYRLQDRSGVSSVWLEDPNTRLSWSSASDIKNEVLIAYEIGYRGRLAERLELNVEAFLNQHQDMIGHLATDIPYTRTNQNNARVQNRTYTNRQYANVRDLTTYGVELSMDWRPYRWWLLRPSYTYTHQTEEKTLNEETIHGDLGLYTVPKHQAKMTNRFYLSKSTTLNTHLSWTDSYYDSSGTNNSDRTSPFWRFDIRLAHRFWKDRAEVAIGATNLNDHFHSEGGDGSDSQEVPRQFYIQGFLEF